MWREKRAAIAQTVEELGDKIRPAMRARRAGWLLYLQTAYPDGAAALPQSVGEGTLVVPDDE